MKRVARTYAGEQYADLRQDQRRRQSTRERAQSALDAGDGAGAYGLDAVHQPMSPAYFCNTAQASSPNLARAFL